MIVKIKDKEYSFDGYVNTINSIQKIGIDCYEQGATDMEKAKQIIIDSLLKQIEHTRKDAIDEILQKMKQLKLDEHCPDGCHCSIEQQSCPYNECNNDVIIILEQLKEK